MAKAQLIVRYQFLSNGDIRPTSCDIHYFGESWEYRVGPDPWFIAHEVNAPTVPQAQESMALALSLPTSKAYPFRDLYFQTQERRNGNDTQSTDG